jgi:DNA-binding response OmpR family regulator
MDEANPTAPAAYPERIVALVRETVRDIRIESKAVLACLWLLDNRGRAVRRIADRDILQANGVALAASQIDVLLRTTLGTTTPMGMRLRAFGETFAFLEIHFVQGDALARERWLGRRLESLTDVLCAARAIATVEAGRRGKILIVDDDESTRQLLRILLLREGFDVVEVGDGAAAEELAIREQPDLIIMDWYLPVVTGPQATRKLKRNPQTAAIPVIMLTSASQLADRLAALQSGVQDFISKPFERRDLMVRIEAQLRWRHLLAEVESVPVVAERHAGVEVLRSHREVRADIDRVIESAEGLESRREFSLAARAYQHAAEVAHEYVNPDVANKLYRLAGKMYLRWTESACRAGDIERGYACAVRAFVAAGNLRSTKTPADNAGAAEQREKEEPLAG